MIGREQRKQRDKKRSRRKEEALQKQKPSWAKAENIFREVGARAKT